MLDFPEEAGNCGIIEARLSFKVLPQTALIGPQFGYLSILLADDGEYPYRCTQHSRHQWNHALPVHHFSRFSSWRIPPLLMTEALAEVQRHSVSTARHTIEEFISAVFAAKPSLQQLTMTVKDLKKEVFSGTRMDEKYIREVLKYEMGLHQGVNARGEPAPARYSYWRFAEVHTGTGVEKQVQEVVSIYPQRFWVFPRKRFVEDPEIPTEASEEVTEVDSLPF